jgi:hypothetical protein
MAADEHITLFDLIGREWDSDEVQSVVSHYNGLKAINLTSCWIYDFCGSGVKIFADKTGDGNEINKIYIYDAEHSIYYRQVTKMPGDMGIGQSQEKMRELLGDPYGAHIGRTQPASITPDGGCRLPQRSDGLDCYHSSQLAERLMIRSLKPFLLTIRYPLGWGDLKQIHDAEGNLLLSVAESQHVGEITLEMWDGPIPERFGLYSVDELIANAASLKSMLNDWDV